MFNTAKIFFMKSIWEPVQENLTAVMFWGGLGGIIIGMLNDGGVAEFFLKTGSAILGAGVFAVIMKSSQFTNLFQDHIYEVFYRPEKIGEGVKIVDKWRILTENLLKTILPHSYEDAAKKLEKNFFNDELAYHFEDHSMKYDINISEHNIASVTSTTVTTILLSDNKADPVMHQTVTGDENAQLISLFLNGKVVTNENCKFFKDKENPKLVHLKVNLNDYKNSDTDKTIKMERVFTWDQDLHNDPTISGYISRYVKGFDVKVKVSKEYKVKFSIFSGKPIPEENHHGNDGSGYERWQVAQSGTLLLPGQGFFYAIIKQ